MLTHKILWLVWIINIKIGNIKIQSELFNDFKAFDAQS